MNTRRFCGRLATIVGATIVVALAGMGPVVAQTDPEPQLFVMDTSAHTDVGEPVDILIEVYDKAFEGQPLDGDHLVYTLDTPPALGAVTNDGALFTYLITEQFEGTETFTVAVSDGEARSTGTVSVVVGGEADPPWVSVSATPPGPEILATGSCYADKAVTVEQSEGFSISRSGNRGEPLTAVISTRLAPQSDYVLPPTIEEYTFGVGVDRLFVPRAPGGQSSISPASWSAEVLDSPDGSYQNVFERTASFTGYTPGTDVDQPCQLADRTETLTLAVGEELHGPIWFGRGSTFRRTAGSLPPGITLDEAFGLEGTPTTAGIYNAIVRECPFPDIGRPICANIAYTLTITGDATTTSTSSSTVVTVATPTTAKPTADTIASTGFDDANRSFTGIGVALAGVGLALVGLSRRRSARG